MFVSASGHELCDLATDFDRYAIAEPRLTSGSWIHAGPPFAGAKADVVAEIPFRLPIVRTWFGTPTGRTTLLKYDPPNGLVYSLDAKHATGLLEAEFTRHDEGWSAHVSGWILPRRTMARLALLPVTGPLSQATNAAVLRGLLRAASFVRREDTR